MSECGLCGCPRAGHHEADAAALRGLVEAVNALLAYEQTGAPDFPEWDRLFDALKPAVRAAESAMGKGR